MKKNKKIEKPVDRRIQKTKQLLSNALVALIIQKGYHAVSIKDIIEKANVGRSTFYAHFENKEQLLLTGHETFHQLLNENIPPQNKKRTTIDINFLSLYRHVQEQHHLAKAMIGKEGGEIIYDHLQAIVSHRIEEHFGKESLQQKERLILVNVTASAMVQLLMQWVKSDMPFTPEAMAEKSENLLLKMMG